MYLTQPWHLSPLAAPRIHGNEDKFSPILGSCSWVVASPCELINPSYWQVGMVLDWFVLQFNHPLWACTRYNLWEVRLCLCVGVVMDNNNCSQKDPKFLRPRKNKCWVVWPSHYCDAQNYYDLKKINVEWSAKNNYYDLEKINVEWSGTHLKIMCTGSWKCLRTKNKWSDPKTLFVFLSHKNYR